jgi:hypothetical protein
MESTETAVFITFIFCSINTFHKFKNRSCIESAAILSKYLPDICKLCWNMQRMCNVQYYLGTTVECNWNAKNFSSTNFNKIPWNILGMKLVDREQVDMKLCIHFMHFVLRMLKKYVNFESSLNDIPFRSVNQAVISTVLLHRQQFHLFYWCNATGIYHLKDTKMLCKLNRKQILITVL